MVFTTLIVHCVWNINNRKVFEFLFIKQGGSYKANHIKPQSFKHVAGLVT